MTSVLGRVGVQRGAADKRAALPGSALPAPARTRRPLLAVGSIAVIVASVAAFVTIYADASHQVPVLVVVRPVAAGAEITAADLGEDGISSSGSLDAVPASQASTVVGRLAGVPLAPGSLLALSEVTSGQPIKAGDAVVGIALKDGQLPASGLQPGDQVMVVQTNAPGSPVTASSTVPSSPGSGPTSMAPNGTGSSTGVLVPVARVTTVAQPASGSSGSETELVSVEVSETLAAQVSVAAAADQVSLVLVPGNGGAS